MAVSWPQTGQTEEFSALGHDGSQTWTFTQPQPAPAQNASFYAAVDCEGRAFYSGTQDDLSTGGRVGLLQQLTLPSAGGPSVATVKFDASSPIVIKSCGDTVGQAIMVTPDSTKLIQTFCEYGPNCVPYSQCGLIQWDISGPTPQVVKVDRNNGVITGFFQGIAYANIGGIEHAYLPTTNGLVIDWNISFYQRDPDIALAPPGEALTTPVVSANRWLITAERNTGIVHVYDLVNPSNSSSFPLDGASFITTQAAIGPDGMYYIIGDNSTVYRIDVPGFLEGPVPVEDGSDALVVDLPHYLRAIGDGQVKGPEGVAATSGGAVAVADTGGSSVKLLAPDGGLVRAIGRIGTSEGNFKRPKDIAVAAGSGGRLYIADTENSRIQVLDPDGNVLVAFGRKGSGLGEFRNPAGVAVHSLGHIMVADTGNNRVQVFDGSGSFLSTLGTFDRPVGIAVDSDEAVYVACSGSSRIEVVTSEGAQLRTLIPDGLKSPTGVAIGPGGVLYVSSTGAHQVVALDKRDGQILGTLGKFGFGADEFDAPHGLAWDLDGQLLYVADTGNNRVCVYGYAPAFTIVAGQQPGERPSSLTIPSSCCGGSTAGTGGTPSDGAPTAPPTSTPPSIPPSGQTGLALNGVAVSPNPVDLRNGQVLNISFGVNMPARVTVFIYDKQHRAVFEFPEQSVVSVGSVQWDGRTTRGTPAPPGAYAVSLVATNGQTVVSQTLEVTVTNKGGNVPGNTSPRRRASQ